MNGLGKKDIDVLRDRFRKNKEGEVFRLLEKGRRVRLGVGMRRATVGSPSCFLELIIQLSLKDESVNLERFERIIVVLHALQARGYMFSFQDGSSSIACEKEVGESNMVNEYDALQSLVREYSLL